MGAGCCCCCCCCCCCSERGVDWWIGRFSAIFNFGEVGVVRSEGCLKEGFCVLVEISGKEVTERGVAVETTGMFCEGGSAGC